MLFFFLRPATCERRIPSASSDNELSLFFVANNASHKFEEIDADQNVNVSFCDPSSTTWASVSGHARISQDRELVRKHWSASYVVLPIPPNYIYKHQSSNGSPGRLSTYFGDLKDGVHKGDENDPRVAIIEVIPDEIRYWVATKGAIAHAAATAVSVATGNVSSAPGEMRTITKTEVRTFALPFLGRRRYDVDMMLSAYDYGTVECQGECIQK